MEHLHVKVFTGALFQASDYLVVQSGVHHIADGVVPEYLLVLERPDEVMLAKGFKLRVK